MQNARMVGLIWLVVTENLRTQAAEVVQLGNLSGAVADALMVFDGS